MAEIDGFSQKPLAERMRPRDLSEFVGQSHIVGPDSLIKRAIDGDKLFSMILWGPPGCGKTSLANIIANGTKSHFIQISAVLSGVKDIRSAIDEAKKQRQFYKKRTIFFVDEIHRFSKSQQDSFLKHVERGLLTLIGATTENPSFEVIPALMSRCRVITLDALSDKDLTKVLEKAIEDDERGLGNKKLKLTDEAMRHIVSLSEGDVRLALNTLEISASVLNPKVDEKENQQIITLDILEKAVLKKSLVYDKSGDAHYNLISALHKSMRGSDPDAAAYWLMRMIDAGEDPMYIGRRMVRFASEDIGNADPNALNVAINAVEAFRFLGHPEGDLSLLQAAVYLATAPKSNSLYMTLKNVKKAISESGSLPVPMHIRNAPTKLMKELGYGKDYKYPHDYQDAYVPENYLPDQLEEKVFYRPNERGYEKTIKRWLEGWRKLREKRK
ncbi:MAG: AAA family ATPase [Proteobacteria bacterium]|nr:MAG: AAA family ATPase [Pseudomonadota bacterium]